MKTRILVFSDSHGRNDRMMQVIREAQGIDRIIHLGDLEGAENLLLMESGYPVDMVRGNCDYTSSAVPEKILLIGGWEILLTHGHHYYVNFGPKVLADAALMRKCRIALYGHTHTPSVETVNGVITVNPGSISLPRQADRRPTYMIMTIEDEKEPEFELCYA